MRFANLVCGEPHPDFLLDRLTRQHYDEIKAHYETDLLPDQRLGMEGAFTRFLIARAVGARGLELDGFILKLAGDDEGTRADEEQDQDEMNRQMMKIAALFDARQSDPTSPA